jgi:thiamine biosynthesis lipoprotein
VPKTRAILSFGALALCAGCADQDAAVERAFPALGTLVTVEIHDAESSRADRAATEIQAYLGRIGIEWYAWGEGELGRVNAALARGESAPVSAELAAPIGRAIEIRALSDGFFDPTVGLLVQAWGFHDAGAPPAAPPSAAWLAEWRAGAAARAALTVADGVVSAPGPIKLALGGIAKGTALRDALRMLSDAGIRHALVDAGGDLAVIGSKLGRRWRIGVRDPRSDGIIGMVELESGEAVFSSGDYERFFDQDGQRFHHLLDPHTGKPVSHTAGVTVIHGDPEMADAAATALMAAGPDRFDALTARMGIRLALLVAADGEILTTDAMAARFDTIGHKQDKDL